MKTLCLLLILCTAVLGQTIVHTLDAPSANVRGLAWDANLGILWTLDATTSYVYALDPVTGAVITSWEMSGPAGYSPAGLAYYDNYLFGSFIDGGSNTYIYWYSIGGSIGGNQLLTDSPYLTGLSWNGTDMYGSTTYSSYEGCYTYPFSGSSFTGQSTYIDDYEGNPDGHDIAYDNGDIWMAVNAGTNPIRRYNTGGFVTGVIPDTIGIGTEIRGLTYEEGEYLWASNITTDKIYKIDVSNVALDRATWGEIKSLF